MPSLIKATVAGADSNSYVTLVEAEAYFSTRLNVTVWTATGATDREKALITACRRIEQARPLVNRRPYGYPGEPQDSLVYDSLAPADPAQALSFPRKKDRNRASGASIIPQPAKDAQCEEALALLSYGAEAERRSALQAAGVRSFAVDGLSESYDPGMASQSLSSAEARRLIGPYLRKGGVLATSDYPDGEFTAGSRP